MRTKTLLLAAAAIAAGALTSMAQSNVYSLNIVGYVNLTVPGNQYAAVANPLDNGTNTISSLFPTAPNGSTVQILSGGVLQPSTKTKGTWLPSDFTLAPGEGFFIKVAQATDSTNLFIGSSPTSNSVALAGGVTVLAGSPIPFSGTLTDSGPNTLNLNVLPNGSTVSILAGGVLQPSTKTKGTWLPSNPTISVGQGFYITPASATTWSQEVQ